MTSLKAQSRAKLGRSEFVAKWSCAFREQTDSRPSKKTKKKTKETKDAKKKRYGCTLSESVDSMCIRNTYRNAMLCANVMILYNI